MEQHVGVRDEATVVVAMAMEVDAAAQAERRDRVGELGGVVAPERRPDQVEVGRREVARQAREGLDRHVLRLARLQRAHVDDRDAAGGERRVGGSRGDQRRLVDRRSHREQAAAQLGDGGQALLLLVRRLEQHGVELADERRVALETRAHAGIDVLGRQPVLAERADRPGVVEHQPRVRSPAQRREPCARQTRRHHHHVGLGEAPRRPSDGRPAGAASARRRAPAAAASGARGRRSCAFSTDRTPRGTIITSSRSNLGVRLAAARFSPSTGGTMTAICMWIPRRLAAIARSSADAACPLSRISVFVRRMACMPDESTRRLRATGRPRRTAPRALRGTA